MDPCEAAFGYHERTKHHFQRYARGPGQLDWANQPDPFRRYEGAPLTPLRLAREDQTPPYEALFRRENVAPRPVDLAALSEFFRLSLALSAWKEYRGSRWALRCNPSSGNLHPTEGYLVIGPVSGLHDRPVVCHYAPGAHALERRTAFEPATWEQLMAPFPPGSFLVGLTSVHWREAWKYGERAYRYCQHDAGHAIAALRFAAAGMGWRMRALEALGDEQVAALLGVDRGDYANEADREHPDLMAVVMPSSAASPVPAALPEAPIRTIARGHWSGTPNALSREYVRWDAIDEASRACAKPEGQAHGPPAEPSIREPEVEAATHLEAASRARHPQTARQIILKRRSALGFDGVTSLPREQFYLMLSRVLPSAIRAPMDVLGAPAAIHLFMFVHLVDGLRPGLYALVRDAADLPTLRSAMRDDFAWTAVPDGPPGLPLYFLLEADCRRAATAVSCHQFIAGESAMSLGMVARFEASIRAHGAWFYRRLFWEAGLIGQVLYLEAEAAGLRATGIGCYFDDAMHDLLGLEGTAFQSMYHFTVGGPVEDARLTTLPPYGETQRG